MSPFFPTDPDGRDDGSNAGRPAIGVERAASPLPLSRRLQGDRFAGFEGDEIYLEVEREKREGALPQDPTASPESHNDSESSES